MVRDPSNWVFGYPIPQDFHSEWYQAIDGTFADKYGNLSLKEAVEAHIPVDEYNFEKISKVITHG